MKSLVAAMARLGIGLEVSEEAIRHLALSGFSSQYGARQIGGVVRSQLARPISKKIVNEEAKAGQTIKVGWDTEKESVSWEIV